MPSKSVTSDRCWIALGWGGPRTARTDERRKEYAGRAKRDGLCVESGYGDCLDTVATWDGAKWKAVCVGAELPRPAIWYCVCRPPGPHYLYCGPSIVTLQLAVNGDFIDVRPDGVAMNRARAPGVINRWQISRGRAWACNTVVDVMKPLEEYEK